MTSPLEPKDQSDPTAALQLSRKAPAVIAKSFSIPDSLPLSLFSSAESPETWAELVQLCYACLRTGDDKSAHLCLERLTQRFGPENERIMAMRGMYQEAVAEDDDTLRKIIQEYNKLLTENPMNVPIHKRRIALVRAMGRHQDAIHALVDFLESFPTDVEGWCELGDIYQTQGLAAQAIYCVEEALISAPNAWNLHARLGELEYMNSVSSSEGSDANQKSLVQAIQRFCRSIELCDDYLRGYYGLKLAVSKLLQSSGQARTGNVISNEKLQKLDDLATTKLKTLVKERSTKTLSERNQSEVIAAQALLDRSKA